MKKIKALLCLCLVIVTVFSVGVGTVGVQGEIVNKSHLHAHSKRDGLTQIDNLKLIDALTMDELDENKYLNRVTDLEESLYDVVYECADGNNIAYFFQYPVKYYDESDMIKDISTSITLNPAFKSKNAAKRIGSKTLDLAKYEYASEKNTIKVYYGNGNGSEDLVVATKGDYYISLTPFSAFGNKAQTAQLKSYDNNAHRKTSGEFAGIEYPDTFGEKTALIYNTTYTGIKEIIKVDEYTGNNKYSFRLVTGGLIPLLDESGGIILIDGAANITAARIAPIFVYDSSEKQKYSQKSYYTVKRYIENSDEYIVTLNLDESFMDDETTTYPVYIDPTVSFSSVSSIEDAPIYSGLPNAATGANYFNCIGYVDDTYKTGSLLVKFPALQSSTLYNSLPTSKIHAVIYNAYKVGGGSLSYTSTLGIYHYNGAAWNESTVTYNSANINSNTGAYVGSVSMKENKKYEIDITSAAIAWRLGSKSYSKGLVIKNNSSSTNHSYERDIASTEYGASVNNNVMPYVQLVYSTNSATGPFFNEHDAAMDCANKYYDYMRYTKIEYFANIYLKNGYYYYAVPHHGTPHSVAFSYSVPAGATYIGYLHLQFDDESVSYDEIITAQSHNSVGYVVTLRRKIYSIDNESPVAHHIGNLSYNYYSLTNYEKTALENQLRSVWNNHFNSSNQCRQGFGCDKYNWPNLTTYY